MVNQMFHESVEFFLSLNTSFQRSPLQVGIVALEYFLFRWGHVIDQCRSSDGHSKAAVIDVNTYASHLGIHNAIWPHVLLARKRGSFATKTTNVLDGGDLHDAHLNPRRCGRHSNVGEIPPRGFFWFQVVCKRLIWDCSDESHSGI